MQPAEHVPVEAFPGAIAVVERQIEQRQRDIVDLVLVDRHRDPSGRKRWPILFELAMRTIGGLRLPRESVIRLFVVGPRSQSLRRKPAHRRRNPFA
jgi:hypothetical protein